MSETPASRDGYTLPLQDFVSLFWGFVWFSFAFEALNVLFQLQSCCPGYAGSSVTPAAALSLAQQPLEDAIPILCCCVVGFMAVEKTVWPCLLQIVGRTCRSENWHGWEVDLKKGDCFTCVHQSLLERRSTRLLSAASAMQVILSAHKIQGLSFIQFFPSYLACLQPSGLLGQGPGPPWAAVAQRPAPGSWRAQGALSPSSHAMSGRQRESWALGAAPLGWELLWVPQPAPCFLHGSDPAQWRAWVSGGKI